MNETWSLTWAFRNIMAEMLMPPLIWILLGLFFLIFFRNKRKIQSILVGLMFLLLGLTSSTFFSQHVYQMTDPWMHWPKPLDFARLPLQKIQKEELQEVERDKSSLEENLVKNKTKNIHNYSSILRENILLNKNVIQPQAIVILGGGIRNGAIELPQYQNQDVSKEAMERLRMGARLAKVTQLPILVAGGRPDRTQVQDRSEAEIMAQVLTNELGVQAKWLETKSNTTQENASFSAKILQENTIQSIYLVSNDWHLPRATDVFEKEGFIVTSAPTGFQYQEQMTPLDYFPSVQGFAQTRHYWHEIMGRIWYALQ